MAGIYPFVEKPLKGVAAFHQISEASSQSQAAVLLMLGRHLRGDDAALAARAGAARSSKHLSLTALKSESEFPVPRLPSTLRRVPVTDTTRALASLHNYKPRAGGGNWEKACGDCAERFYQKPTHESAAQLFEVCLGHPRDLVKIAAAHSYFRLSSNTRRLLKILVDGVKSTDELERGLAATALARVAPDHPALRPLSKGRTGTKGRQPAHTITLVHGTWASGSSWYQPPDGDFFKFVKALRPDLYSNRADFFKWTGGYSDAARADGANGLVNWVAGHNVAGLDLMSHSHGGSVCMLATQLGMQAGKLVLLSCPVHVDRYMPNFPNITKGVYSIHVKLDLVILVDGGGQKFNHPQIKEIVLPIWFNHFATHDPQVWQNNNLSAKIAL